MGGSGKVKVISSGSIGNCIVLSNSDNKCILLDVGIGYRDILKSLNWDLNNCVSAFCTHKHRDHSKALAHCIANGIPCYANQDICDHYKGCNLIENGKALLVDGWKVQTFDLVHNAPNNAFVVDTIDGVRVLYCTDTQYIPKRVRGVNVAIIEANFDEEVLIDNMCENIEIRSQFENHHSLDKCIEYLRSIYSKDLMSVILWHPSSTNLDKKKAVERVKYELGFDNVYMAESGLEVELSNSEF